MIGNQGIVIVEVIELVGEFFEDNNKSYKVLIIIIDGENYEEEVLVVVEVVVEEGFIFYIVGVGMIEGSFIIIR